MIHWLVLTQRRKPLEMVRVGQYRQQSLQLLIDVFWISSPWFVLLNAGDRRSGTLFNVNPFLHFFELFIPLLDISYRQGLLTKGSLQHPKRFCTRNFISLMHFNAISLLDKIIYWTNRKKNFLCRTKRKRSWSTKDVYGLELDTDVYQFRKKNISN